MTGKRILARENATPTALALLTILLSATPASSQNGLDNLVGVATMNGTCASLVVRGADVTRQCQGRLINSVHADSRSGFAFLRTGEIVVSFAGQDHAAVGDRATLDVDMVLVAHGGTTGPVRPEVIPASGTCTYTNPYAGVSTVTCAATTRQGEFRAVFRSDGRAPDVQRFQH